MINSAEEFIQLRRSAFVQDYKRATREEAPLEVWNALIRDYPQMRRWVAHNKTVPVEILACLSDDPDDNVRWVVATKRQLPEVLQIRLTGDPVESVRERLVYNARTTRATLEILQRDASESIRLKAASRLTRGEYMSAPIA